MADAVRDNNNVPSLLGVSSSDLITPTRIAANPTTKALLIDSTSLYSGLDTRYLKLDTSNDPLTGDLLFSGSQKIIGGTGTTSDLTLQTTSGVGATGADMHFLVGNNGATEAMTILNDGKIGLNNNSPTVQLHMLASAPEARLGIDLTNYSGLKKIANSTALKDVSSSGNSLIDLDPIPSDGTSSSTFRFFRSVNTSGSVALSIYSGDGTSNIQHSFGRTTSYVNLTAGNFGVGIGTSLGAKLHVLATTVQLRLGYDASNYNSFTVAPTGSLTIAATGTNPDIILTPGGTGYTILNGNVGIGTTAPTNLLSLGGNSARIFWMERHTTADTAGNTLTITAGGATSGATNKAGGNLILQGGLSTGSAESGVILQGVVAGASGTSDRTQTTEIQVLGNKIGLFGVTPVIQPAAANQAALTNSTTGSYDGTLADVGVVFSQAAINNNFTDVYTLLTEIRTALVNVGIIKGSA